MSEIDLERQNLSFTNQCLVVYKFKIEGMTCVACSGAIEKGLTNEFGGKGLALDNTLASSGVNVVLLMHQMRITFHKEIAEENKITADTIIGEVEDLGFGAALLEKFEMDAQSEAGMSSRGDQTPRQQVRESTFIVKGMTCASCSGAIENHFNSGVEGSISINISLLTNKAVVKHDITKLRPRQIISEIEDLGFDAELQPNDQATDIREIVKEEVAQYKKRLIQAVVIYLPIAFMVWVVPYVSGLNDFMAHPVVWNGNTLYVFLLLVLTSVMQFYMGGHFYSSAWKSVKHKSANMDVLIVISTTAAYLYGVILMLIGYTEEEQKALNFRMMVHNHVHNWETAAVLIGIIVVGKYIESYSKMKTVGQLSQLASLKVTKAYLVHEKDTKKLNLNCKYSEIAVELLEKKDFVLVHPGDAVPTDGSVVFGRGLCNESMLTGEARPVPKEIGIKVFGGTILTQGSIIVKVEKTSEDATFNQIMKLVENAQNTKAPIQGLADRISAVFVPMIVALAVLAWIVWYSIVFSDEENSFGLEGNPNTSKFEFAFDFGISTLVIACPCALGLATPTAVMVGTGLAASFGILIKSADILEKIHKIDTIVFDKTGTLTSGKPKVRDMIACSDSFKIQGASTDNTFLQSMLYLLEQPSEHPIAQSICSQVEKNIPTVSGLSKYKVQNFKNRNGEGVVATIHDVEANKTYEVLCGNTKLMNSNKILENYPDLARNVGYLEEEGKTVVVLAIDNLPQLIVSLEEEHLSKAESLTVVNHLKHKMGMRVCMITGDNKFSALKVAKHLGIDPQNVTYSAYPDTKRQVVQKYQKEGSKVMFVGDGINDSPVLAQADVGCAINSASDVTVGAAGIVLIKDDLEDVLKAILIAKKTFRRIQINFFFAFVYNVTLIPVAMGIFYPLDGFKLDPMFAAIAMALSSISVVTSSLILKLYKPEIQPTKATEQKLNTSFGSYLNASTSSSKILPTVETDDSPITMEARRLNCSARQSSEVNLKEPDSLK